MITTAFCKYCRVGVEHPYFFVITDMFLHYISFYPITLPQTVDIALSEIRCTYNVPCSVLRAKLALSHLIHSNSPLVLLYYSPFTGESQTE